MERGTGRECKVKGLFHPVITGLSFTSQTSFEWIRQCGQQVFSERVVPILRPHWLSSSLLQGRLIVNVTLQQQQPNERRRRHNTALPCFSVQSGHTVLTTDKVILSQHICSLVKWPCDWLGLAVVRSARQSMYFRWRF